MKGETFYMKHLAVMDHKSDFKDSCCVESKAAGIERSYHISEYNLSREKCITCFSIVYYSSFQQYGLLAALNQKRLVMIDHRTNCWSERLRQVEHISHVSP